MHALSIIAPDPDIIIGYYRLRGCNSLQMFGIKTVGRGRPYLYTGFKTGIIRCPANVATLIAPENYRFKRCSAVNAESCNRRIFLSAYRFIFTQFHKLHPSSQWKQLSSSHVLIHNCIISLILLKLPILNYRFTPKYCNRYRGTYIKTVSYGNFDSPQLFV